MMKYEWIVGVQEIATFTYYISQAIPSSYSVMIYPHKFYNFVYNYQYKKLLNRFNKYKLLFAGPWKFGELVCISRGFFYIGKSGFLFSHVDQREWEFKFLKKKNKKIVLYFTGADIRSYQLMLENFHNTNEENISNYITWANPSIFSNKHEEESKRISLIADRYADLIFNAKFDQAAYLKRQTSPFYYFVPMKNKKFNFKKFENIDLQRIRILHAPSSPITKGTQVVRTVIRMLVNEGYDFEFIECQDANASTLDNFLIKAHIVINELFAFTPGVLSIEALARSCVVLTRADSLYETQLPPNSNKAWVVTPAYDLYKNLKNLLDNPQKLAEQAEFGFWWANKFASLESNSLILNQKLNYILNSEK